MLLQRRSRGAVPIGRIRPPRAPEPLLLVTVDLPGAIAGRRRPPSGSSLIVVRAICTPATVSELKAVDQRWGIQFSLPKPRRSADVPQGLCKRVPIVTHHHLQCSVRTREWADAVLRQSRADASVARGNTLKPRSPVILPWGKVAQRPSFVIRTVLSNQLRRRLTKHREVRGRLANLCSGDMVRSPAVMPSRSRQRGGGTGHRTAHTNLLLSSLDHSAAPGFFATALIATGAHSLKQ